MIVCKGDLLKAWKALLSGIRQVGQWVQNGCLESASPMVSLIEGLNNVIELVLAFLSPSSGVADESLEVNTAPVV